MEHEYEIRSVWAHIDADEKSEMEAYAKRYMHFLDQAKTEREAAKTIVDLAQEAGYRSFEDVWPTARPRKRDRAFT